MNSNLEKQEAILREIAALPEGRRLKQLKSAEKDLTQQLIELAAAAEYISNGDVSQGLAYCEMVRDLADESGSAAARARSRAALGQALSHAGRFEEAVQTLKQGVAAGEQTDEKEQTAWCFMVLVHPLAQLSLYEEAAEAGESARETFLELGNELMAAGVDVSLGAAARMSGDARKALQHYDRARPFLREDKIKLARLDANRGNALYSLYELTRAEQAYRDAMSAFQSLGTDWAVAVMHENLGDLMARQGRYQKALTHFEQAAQLLNAGDSPADVARIRMECAEAQASLGLLQDAVDQYHASLPVLQEHGLKWDRARALLGLSRTLTRLNHRKEALAALEESRSLFHELGHDAFAARADLLRAELAAKTDPDEGINILRGAIGNLQEHPADLALAHHHLAAFYLQLGKPGEAESELNKAFTVAEKLDIAPLLVDLLHLRGKLFLSRGETAQGLQALRSALQQVERIRSSLQAERLRAAFHGEHMFVYRDLVAAILQQGGKDAVREAFSIVEMARSRSLLELVRDSLSDIEKTDQITTDPRKQQLLSRIAELRGKLNALYGELDDLSGPSQRHLSPGAWRETIQECEREIQVLENRLALGFGSSLSVADPVPLAEVQQSLHPEQTLIEYFVTGDYYSAFVISNKEIHLQENLVSQEEIRGLLQRLQFQLIRASRPGALKNGRRLALVTDVQRELQSLYRALVAPVETLLGNSACLTFIPHGILHSLPFHALWNGSAYLCDDFEITVAPSASLLIHSGLSEKAENRDVKESKAVVAGVADPLAPRIEHEARAIARLLPDSQLLVNDDCSLNAFTDSVHRSDLVHIACHGRFFPESPLASGLKLSDSWMTVRDVCSLDLNADLVVLSGCETGRNMIGAGDELHGLLRGFFVAGARSLITSLWAVDDETTECFMTSFYRSRQGKGKENIKNSSAMRLAWRTVKEDYPHPSFWAPFVLIGSP